MINFPRVTLCYHGCVESFATDLLSGKISVDEWNESEKPYDWLGRGIYFWEHAPERAWEWAEQRVRLRQKEETPAIVGAVVQLDNCFDLTDSHFTDRLAKHYPIVAEAFASQNLPVPANEGGDEDLKKRFRDCIVINSLLEFTAEFEAFSSVRGAFPEGGPVFEGARITKRSHIQVAVRDRSCIKGVFRSTFRKGGGS